MTVLHREFNRGDSRHGRSFSMILPMSSLGRNWHEASELALLLKEGGVKVDEAHNLRPVLSNSRSQTPKTRCTRSLLDRIQQAQVLDISQGKLDWSQLVMAIPSEALSEDDSLDADQPLQINLNSGGKVFFCLFRLPPKQHAHHAASHAHHHGHKHPAQSRLAPHAQDASGEQVDPSFASPFAVRGVTYASESEGGESASGAARRGPSSDPVRQPRQHAPDHAHQEVMDPRRYLPDGKSRLAGEHPQHAGHHAQHGHQPHPKKLLPPAIPGGGSAAAGGPREGVVVLKFCGSRLLAQAEQLAAELARHCGVSVPDSRVLHQSGNTSEEWACLMAAAKLMASGEKPPPLQPTGSESGSVSQQATPTGLPPRAVSPNVGAAELPPKPLNSRFDALSSAPAILMVGSQAGLAPGRPRSGSSPPALPLKPFLGAAAPVLPLAPLSEDAPEKAGDENGRVAKGDPLSSPKLPGILIPAAIVELPALPSGPAGLKLCPISSTEKESAQHQDLVVAGKAMQIEKLQEEGGQKVKAGPNASHAVQDALSAHKVVPSLKQKAAVALLQPLQLLPPAVPQHAQHDVVASRESEELLDKAASGGQELLDEMQRVPAALLMAYVPGKKLASSDHPNMKESHFLSVVEDLGRLFALDMVLGNADRLPCRDLSWRGNSGNLLLGAAGSKYSGKVVAIDACVQRRPPASKLDREDDAVDRLSQLILTDPSEQFVVPLLIEQLLHQGPKWLKEAITKTSSSGKAAAAFQNGMRLCLDMVVQLKGLFEMVHERIKEWVAEFIEDIKHQAPGLLGTDDGPALQHGHHHHSYQQQQGSGGSDHRQRASVSAPGNQVGWIPPPPRPRILKLDAGEDAFVTPAGTNRRATSDGITFSAPAVPRARTSLNGAEGIPPIPEAATPTLDGRPRLPRLSVSLPASAPPAVERRCQEVQRRRPSISLTGRSNSVSADDDGGYSSGVMSPTTPSGLNITRSQTSSSPFSSAAEQAMAAAERVPSIGAASTASPTTPQYMHAASLVRSPSNNLQDQLPSPAMQTPAGAVFTPHPPLGTPPPIPTPPGPAGVVHPALPKINVSPVQRSAARCMSLTRALKQVGREERRNQEFSERVTDWKRIFREHSDALRTAAEEWQMRRSINTSLSMGFLSGAAPITDLYELKVRLDHMLRRMKVLEAAAGAHAPVRILQDAPLFLGNAVAADSYHVLRHLGITHILNATEEVATPPPDSGFVVQRLPLRDTDDEDIASRFEEACFFIDTALGKLGFGSQQGNSSGGQTPSILDHINTNTSPKNSDTYPTTPDVDNAPQQDRPAVRQRSFGRVSGRCSSPLAAAGAAGSGGVLVHCSEGRSRSVALVAAYLVSRKGMSLAEAMMLIRLRRPIAAPNAGFGTALIAFELQVRGSSSIEAAEGPGRSSSSSQAAVQVLGAKKGKPEAAKCPVCGAAVGISSASLQYHLRSKHPEEYQQMQQQQQD